MNGTKKKMMKKPYASTPVFAGITARGGSPVVNGHALNMTSPLGSSIGSPMPEEAVESMI